LDEGEWKRKKHQPEYCRQWRKIHICIDAKTLQISAFQLSKNNASDSEVLVDLLDKFHKGSRLILSIQIEFMAQNTADRLLPKFG
jgi:hypothetical protein